MNTTDQNTIRHLKNGKYTPSLKSYISCPTSSSKNQLNFFQNSLVSLIAKGNSIGFDMATLGLYGLIYIIISSEMPALLPECKLVVEVRFHLGMSNRKHRALLIAGNQ